MQVKAYFLDKNEFFSYYCKKFNTKLNKKVLFFWYIVYIYVVFWRNYNFSLYAKAKNR